MHGEAGFDIAWFCQPHKMEHGQHVDLKLLYRLNSVLLLFNKNIQCN